MTSGKRRHWLLRLMTGVTGCVIRSLVYGVIGAFVLLVVAFVIVLERRPDLSIWHTAHLDEEFTADAGVTDLDGYRALEDRLFAQLDRDVYGVSSPETALVNRYERGSLSDPGRWPSDWNRTFELRAEAPRAGVLLLHGLSDSPYSMRSLGEAMHARGATVLGLRIPGHGTAPSGLVHVEWEDWAAAVALAARHVKDEVGDRPLYIAGYSNGGALAVHHALSSLTDDTLPTPDGLILVSPEIGITKLAALAVWQERLGRLLGLRKLSWNSIAVEYDPFKYQSFALNAGNQAYRITAEIQSQITTLTASGDMDRFPPVLAFQSVVDATVSAPALVEGLFARLPADRHELVLFDLDRTDGMQQLFLHDPRAGVDAILSERSRTFAVTLVTNGTDGDRSVVARHAEARRGDTVDTPLGLAWPPGLYSLSHVALPFPPDDPLYGGPDAQPSPGIQIGDAVIRGERGVLAIGPADIMRIRWNPFHEYLERRALEFTGLETGAPR